MATLNAMFRLYDKYSATIDKVNKKTDQATDKILKASGVTDKFNKKLEATGVSAGKANNGLGKLVRTIISLAALKKGINISDEFMNTSARLNLINDGAQTQLELQEKIFAAANRSRGVYSDMASAVSKLQMLAGDAFGSNNETIAFTELMQKSFKVGGASATEQSSAMLQLTQAMASGRLQGDEYRSISENAPLILEAISRYTGKSRGELKQLSTDGLISASIIKNAIFAMSDEINEKFATMPMTFADVWNKIKNGATRAFRPFIQKVNELINTDKFARFSENTVVAFGIIGKAAGGALDKILKVYNFMSKNWDKLGPIIFGVTTAWLAYKGALELVKIAQWALNLATVANPIGLIIALIGLLVAAVLMLWDKSEGFRSFWTDIWIYNMKTLAKAYNFMVPIFNAFGRAYNWMADQMQDFNVVTGKSMIASMRIVAIGVKAMVKSFGFLVDAISSTVKNYNSIAKFLGMKTIDIEINAGNINKAIDLATGKGIASVITATGMSNGLLEKTKLPQLKQLDLDKFNLLVEEVGSKMKDFTFSGWVKDTFAKFAEELAGVTDGHDLFNGPLLVEGTGNNGAVKVDMSDEDLRYLRDIAERDYIAKVANNTLAPNIIVKFGDVHETADADKVAGRIQKILQEEIAMTAEGVYDV